MKLFNNAKDLTAQAKVFFVSLVSEQGIEQTINFSNDVLPSMNNVIKAVNCLKQGHPIAFGTIIANELTKTGYLYTVQINDLVNKNPSDYTDIENTAYKYLVFTSNATGFSIDEINMMPGENVIAKCSGAFSIRSHKDYDNVDCLYKEGLTIIDNVFGKHIKMVKEFNKSIQFIVNFVVGSAFVAKDDKDGQDNIDGVDETFLKQYKEVSGIVED